MEEQDTDDIIVLDVAKRGNTDELEIPAPLLSGEQAVHKSCSTTRDTRSQFKTLSGEQTARRYYKRTFKTLSGETRSNSHAPTTRVLKIVPCIANPVSKRDDLTGKR